MTFDATSRELCTVRRVRTNTPLQALTRSTTQVFVEAARALADRVIDEAAGSSGPTERRERQPRLSTLHIATSDRARDRSRRAIVRASTAALSRRGRREAAKVLAVAADRRDATLAERAAWTLVANSLLNLDETVTKE